MQSLRRRRASGCSSSSRGSTATLQTPPTTASPASTTSHWNAAPTRTPCRSGKSSPNSTSMTAARDCRWHPVPTISKPLSPNHGIIITSPCLQASSTPMSAKPSALGSARTTKGSAISRALTTSDWTSGPQARLTARFPTTGTAPPTSHGPARDTGRTGCRTGKSAATACNASTARASASPSTGPAPRSVETEGISRSACAQG